MKIGSVLQAVERIQVMKMAISKRFYSRTVYLHEFYDSFSTKLTVQIQIFEHR